MQEALLSFILLAGLLAVGLMISRIARKLTLSQELLLLITGLALGTFFPALSLSPALVSTIAIAALALIAFESTARLRPREFDTSIARATKTALLTAGLVLALLTLAAHTLIGLPVAISLLISAILIPTNNQMFHQNTITTPLAIVLPFLILNATQATSLSLAEKITPVLSGLAIGIGTGVFVGVILFKLVHSLWNKPHAWLALVAATLLSYVLAEHLGGNGILAAATLGLFFTSAYAQHKITLLKPEHSLTTTISLLVFLLSGMIVKIPLTRFFIVTSITLFIVYTCLRFITLWLTLHKQHNTHALALMTLVTPTSVETTAVVFVLLAQNIGGIAAPLAFACIIYSHITALITRSLSPSHENHPYRHKSVS